MSDTPQSDAGIGHFKARCEKQVEADPIKEFVALFEKVRALNPIGDGYCEFSITGFGVKPTVRVFYDSECRFNATSFAELQEKVKAFDPAAVKAKQIAELEAKLAELKGEVQS